MVTEQRERERERCDGEGVSGDDDHGGGRWLRDGEDGGVMAVAVVVVWSAEQEGE